jgi:hypothetical protein
VAASRIAAMFLRASARTVTGLPSLVMPRS